MNTRINGQRKIKLINQANLLIGKCDAAGVNVNYLFKVLQIDGNTAKIPTKKMSGLISRIKEFMRANGIQY